MGSGKKENRFPKAVRSGKGGFTGIELIAALAIIGVITFFTIGPITKGIQNLAGGINRAKTVHKVEATRTLYSPNPVTGKMEPVKDTWSEFSSDATAEQPPETLWQKFWHMGFMAIVIIVVLSYLGLWPIITLWWNKIVKPKITQARQDLAAVRYQQDELTNDAKLIVKSVDAGLASMDGHIAGVKAQVEAANAAITAAAQIVDPAQRQAALTVANNMLAVAQAVLVSVTNIKQDFKDAMDTEQDQSTYLRVKAYQTNQDYKAPA